MHNDWDIQLVIFLSVVSDNMPEVDERSGTFRLTMIRPAQEVELMNHALLITLGKTHFIKRKIEMLLLIFLSFI